jgi:hypothetical protein
MKNTQLNLTQAGATKLLKVLEAVPQNERDTTWMLVHADIKKIVEIWNNIDVRKEHMVKISRQAKTNTGSRIAASK